MPDAPPAASHLTLSVVVTPTGAEFRPVAHFEGLTPEQAGKAFGVAVRGATDAARRMRDAIESAHPGGGEQFARGFAKARGSAEGANEMSLRLQFFPES